MTDMTWDWQQIVALGLVAAAAFLLARRAIRLWKSSAVPGCASGCSTCALKDPLAPRSKPLVALNVLQRQPRDSQSAHH
jgi:hypothetical protein